MKKKRLVLLLSFKVIQESTSLKKDQTVKYQQTHPLQDALALIGKFEELRFPFSSGAFSLRHFVHVFFRCKFNLYIDDDLSRVLVGRSILPEYSSSVLLIMYSITV